MVTKISCHLSTVSEETRDFFLPVHNEYYRIQENKSVTKSKQSIFSLSVPLAAGEIDRLDIRCLRWSSARGNVHVILHGCDVVKEEEEKVWGCKRFVARLK